MYNTGKQFARAQLEKYGWKEGKGLGREEGGITSALKPKLKFDTAGFGHGISKDYQFHWWDHVFNKTAKSISVNKNQDGSVQLTKKKKIQISKPKPSRLDHKTKLYGIFLKGSTLVGAQEVKESSDSEEPEDEEDLSLKLTDEELFKICGGRTAHKGARHGLTMSGKLARIEEQERLLMQKCSMSAEQSHEEPCKAEAVGKKKMKKLRQNSIEDISEIGKKTLDVINEPINKRNKVSENEVPYLSTEDLKKDKISKKRKAIKRK
nr:G patch domain-containing protein 4-like isoform X1 [Cherax quadricarinatus]